MGCACTGMHAPCCSLESSQIKNVPVASATHTPDRDRKGTVRVAITGSKTLNDSIRRRSRLGLACWTRAPTVTVCILFVFVMPAYAACLSQLVAPCPAPRYRELRLGKSRHAHRVMHSFPIHHSRFTIGLLHSKDVSASAHAEWLL